LRGSTATLISAGIRWSDTIVGGSHQRHHGDTKLCRVLL
jgi:hypothetical protein